MADLTDTILKGIKKFASEVRISLIIALFLAVLVCGVYPMAVWITAQGLFPERANGSIIMRERKVLGSSLIGREFSAPGHFHGRPSAAGSGYEATASGGSNLGPTSRKLVEGVRERVARYRLENGMPEAEPVPADAVTASASGLDPHISLENARLQARRVARARGTSEEAVFAKIEAHVQGRDLGFLGEPRVNLLLLNLDLDKGP